MTHLVEIYRDTEILLNDESRFEAVINKAVRTRASLSTIKRLIDDNADAIPVIIVHNDIGIKPRKSELVRVKKPDSYSRTFVTRDGEFQNYWYHVYHFDYEIFQQLLDLNERHNEAIREFEKEFAEIIKQATEVDPLNISGTQV